MSSIHFYIDRKGTIWEREVCRANLTDEELVKVINDTVKDGDGTLINICNEHDDIWTDDYETLSETFELLTPEENQGESTVEIYTSNGNLIYDNRIKNEEDVVMEKDKVLEGEVIGNKVFYVADMEAEDTPVFVKGENDNVIKSESYLDAEKVIAEKGLKMAAVVERKEHTYSEEYVNAMKKLEMEEI